MKEMIKALIADGWEWVAINKGEEESVILSSVEPHKDDYGDFKITSSDVEKTTRVPKSLLPDITFENSPVELKTLLVDEEESEEQEFIRCCLAHGCVYIIRHFDDECYILQNDEFVNVKDIDLDISNLCPNKYEKVYFENLVKKRKVKKSVWVAVNKNGDVYFFTTKPKRENDSWVSKRSFLVYSLRFLEWIELTWEDEPIKLTYEVKE